MAHSLTRGCGRCIRPSRGTLQGPGLLPRPGGLESERRSGIPTPLTTRDVVVTRAREGPPCQVTVCHRVAGPAGGTFPRDPPEPQREQPSSWTVGTRGLHPAGGLPTRVHSRGSFPSGTGALFVVQRTCNEIKRLFGRLDPCPRMFSRFEKLDGMSTALIHLALIGEALRLQERLPTWGMDELLAVTVYRTT